MNHSQLVDIGYKWLLKQCSFAFKEPVTMVNEQPDVIGWKSGYSVVIECKTSRADFKADFKKLFRQHENLGLGNYRFYLCPSNIIQKEDLPDKWGLLWFDESLKKITRIYAPIGNIWSRFPQFESNIKSENAILYSALRRLKKGNNFEELFKIK